MAEDENQRRNEHPLSDLGGEVLGEMAGAAFDGMGGCLEGCAGCSLVIVGFTLTGVALVGWLASSLLA